MTATETAANLAVALAPGFAAGFAVQQLLQIIDPFIEGPKLSANQKKAVMGLLSLLIGLLIAWLGNMHILATLKAATGGGGTPDSMLLDIFVSGLIISAGTEGFNSIMKFAGYKKDAAKAAAGIQAVAADKAKTDGGQTALTLLNR